MVKNMLKIIISWFMIFVISFMGICVSSEVASASDNIKIFLNGKELYSDQPPLNIGGRVLVPIRVIAEGIGCDVSWWEDDRIANIVKDNVVLAIQINNDIISTLDTSTDKKKIYSLDVPAALINSRTYVPIRMISERFSLEVSWDGNVHLKSTRYIPRVLAMETVTRPVVLSPVALIKNGRLNIVSGQMFSPDLASEELLTNIFGIQCEEDGDYLHIKHSGKHIKMKNGDNLVLVNKKMDFCQPRPVKGSDGWKLPISYIATFLNSTYSHDSSNKVVKINYIGNEYIIPYNAFTDSSLLTSNYGDVRWMEKNNKYGYVNSETNEVLIPYTYDYAYPFVEGTSLVFKGNKWSYIGKDGEKVK